jgi:hypothetical protein
LLPPAFHDFLAIDLAHASFHVFQLMLPPFIARDDFVTWSCLSRSYFTGIKISFMKINGKLSTCVIPNLLWVAKQWREFKIPSSQSVNIFQQFLHFHYEIILGWRFMSSKEQLTHSLIFDSRFLILCAAFCRV